MTAPEYRVGRLLVAQSGRGLAQRETSANGHKADPGKRIKGVYAGALVSGISCRG